MSTTTATDVRGAARRFREDGYLILRDVLNPDELGLLQEETLAQIEAGPDRDPRGDFVTKPSPGGDKTFFRVQFLTSKAIRNASADLTGFERELQVMDRGQAIVTAAYRDVPIPILAPDYDEIAAL